ncbi:MAG: hypothetical protein HOB40_07045 [Candidatus Marinimicrobia bacterium]|jgi:hypothetical protein|nr:hypothetical protein [Candidatus Neomarinimicrobiota bacterium]MBT3500737.1 hypothetical protein [Candidatus Neomarinimicrobiota bacterium]MBT3838684.1 hypothetical protein [Candidatus Neomarinimicrobiota bacterium]MBT3998370.1 hypothetical protein [Candidatus Neomarinimicrobiota bacterium]MBT4283610.1 hypothetical protein [Candidatus Neomarinimicrobiota bacterium]
MNIFKRVLIFLGVILLFGCGFIINNLSDRHPDYSVNISIKDNQPHPIKAGFAKVSITPSGFDTWNDVDSNAKYEPDDGDTYNDLNENSEFDPVWIAGFHNQRPAQGVHDDIWARVMVLETGDTRLAIVGLDAVGFLHDEVVDIRKSLAESLELDYCIIASTHNHEGPDLVGIWGESFLSSGVNPDYMEDVKSKTKIAIEEAVAQLRPAKLRFAQDLVNGARFVMDTRKPEELDAGLRIIQAIDIEADTTLGSLVSWGNHPETLWSENLLITSDFPHYIRETVEKGIHRDGTTLVEGIGGTAVYMSSSVGGLMTTRPPFEIPDMFTGEMLTGATFEKTEAQGQNIGYLLLRALSGDQSVDITESSISIMAKTVLLPLENNYWKLGFALGVIKHGLSGWMEVRTEVAAFKIGPASFLSIPGEIYPEIVNGGVVSPPGQDYPISPIEVPYLRSIMDGQFKFVFGLANDEIGYIIPKSEWDVEPPYLYNADSSPYGEINSLGSKTGPIIYSHLVDLINKLK